MSGDGNAKTVCSEKGNISVCGIAYEILKGENGVINLDTVKGGAIQYWFDIVSQNQS